MGRLKWTISVVAMLLILVFVFPVLASENKSGDFMDVPKGHWAYDAIQELRTRKIVEGQSGNKFGLGQSILRSEFVSMLVRLMEIDITDNEAGSFKDNQNTKKWYFNIVETALAEGIIVEEDYFRPEEKITREEMAIMIVRALGYDSLAKQLNYLEKPFHDVTMNHGYISMAKDFGIISGTGNGLFEPGAYATREAAATMMIRMIQSLDKEITDIHGFYAIASYGQRELMKDMSSVGFGWSRLEYEKETDTVILNLDRKNNNEYALPTGFEAQVEYARTNGATPQLMVFVKNDRAWSHKQEKEVPLTNYILENEGIRKQVIEEITAQLTVTQKGDESVSFDGVVIDFEEMKGEALRTAFNQFLEELRPVLDKNNKKLYVAVHPKRGRGASYYDAYDYKRIGELADKVILMAHDYNAKSLTEAEMNSAYYYTPLTPIHEIYYALKAITDEKTGIADKNKIMLQVSFDTAQWKIKEDVIINKNAYRPSYESLKNRLLQGEYINYSKTYENPYARYYDPADETDNIIWYEDARSIDAKIQLAKHFDITGISIWRLGNIPNYQEPDIALDVFNTISEHLEERR